MNMSRMLIGEWNIRPHIAAILLFTAMSIIGCSSIRAKQYTEPLSGNTATFRIANKAPGRIGVDIYEKADTCSERRILNNTADWITIPAESDLSFTIFLDLDSYNRRMGVIGFLGGPLGILATQSLSDGTNQITIKFSPRRNLYYSVEITNDTKNYTVNLGSSQAKEGPYIAEPTATLMKFHRPFTEKGSWCEPLDLK
jgi:hypothetical protein